MEDTTVQETSEVAATPTGQVETRTVTTNSSASDFLVGKTNQIIFSIISIVGILIALRFLFLLFGANRVGIVDFVLAITNIFVAPFKGIFPSPTTGDAYFETASIVAIICWTILGVILGMVVRMFSAKPE
jgi:hypothetical protein